MPNSYHIFKNLFQTPPREQRYGVDVTPLCYVPGARISNYLGNLNFFFIRESSCIRESGGLSSFVHGFVAEVLAIVRAHVTAIGGNALISYTMSECYLMNNAHKNQVCQFTLYIHNFLINTVSKILIFFFV